MSLEFETDAAPTTSRPPDPPKDAPAHLQRVSVPDATPEESAADAPPAEETDEPTRDPSGRFRRGRHRSAKNDATAADVPRIRELSGKLRKVEEELAAVKASRVDRPASAEPAPEPVGDFTEPKPTINTLLAKGSADPYAEIGEAVQDWKDRKKAHETAVATAAAKVTAANQADLDKLKADYNARLHVFVKTHPDFDEVFKTSGKSGIGVTDITTIAILQDADGPEWVYHLGRYAADRAEAFFLTDGKPLTQDRVNAAKEWLRSRVRARAQAGSTGSAAPREVSYRAPTPPNPVRPGPVSASDDRSLPDGDFDTHVRAMTKLRREEGYGGRRRRF